MKLLIISHTEHYQLPDGTVVGWGATVRELNALADMFDDIYHMAMLHEGTPPLSALPYTAQNIHFIPLKPLGGKSLIAKIQLLWHMSGVIHQVFKYLKKVEVFQFRAPTGIGVVLIPLLTFFTRKHGWYKYAGNWRQQKAPLGYAWQRWCLKHQRRTVTINGFWPQQPKHCLSFENPCLTAAEYALGAEVCQAKSLDKPLELCYAGRVEFEKGVGTFLKAYEALDPKLQQRISTVHIVGEGKDLETFKAQYRNQDRIRFYGALPGNRLFDIYKTSHFFVMPTTASEGFPKVLAEAMNFGCMPMVSDISAIGHYIHNGVNGFLLEAPNAQEVTNGIIKALQLSPHMHQAMMKAGRDTAAKFTFEHYQKRLKKDILEAPNTFKNKDGL
ncbi:glycosyltransferase [Paucihalobacter ruber]|uniref:Glycosyltransferase n=1 Tax=Paucihalobacter ruber TaxID=2567861 RepID=A0A506PK00_9FLAO|nr:glycosyltransferase [Paucihalobacter ruber]TPV33838.1 glycosyltransferase [Paucihalobacter ruber]